MRGSQGLAGRGAWARAENIMAQKQSACRTLCFQTGTAREAQAKQAFIWPGARLRFPRGLIPAGRADGLWLARHLSPPELRVQT